MPDGRVKLGAQLVQLLVEHNFLGQGKWANIILVGTKADRATEEELEFFKTDRVDDRPPGDQQSNTATCSTHSSVDTTKRDRRDTKPTTRANMTSFEADAIHVCE